MIASKPFILYDLPKSRTTQAFLHGNKIEMIWESLERFMPACTNSTINDAEKIILSAYSAYKDDKNPEIADKIIAETKVIFGEGKTQSITQGYPEETKWELNKKDLHKAVYYLQKGQPWPRFSFGPVELFLTYDFKLIDPETKNELANQEFTSTILIWLSKRCSCSPSLWFPFEEGDKSFYKYLNQIEQHLPFTLEHSYLRYGYPNKFKTKHVFKKVIPNAK